MNTPKRNIVIPMAGRGSRFVEAGMATPKPLIAVAGSPMYAHAVASLAPQPDDRLIFVCLQEHCETWGLRDDIVRRFSGHDVHVVSLPAVTDGQLATVLAAADVFVDGSITIFNADTVARHHVASTLATHDVDIDGLIGVFRAPGDHWSFARLGANGYVVETAEKRRISDWATTGLYYFADVKRFVRLAAAMVDHDRRTSGEFYVAPLYNDLIAEGGTVVIDEALEVIALGTPEELEVGAERLESL